MKTPDKMSRFHRGIILLARSSLRQIRLRILLKNLVNYLQCLHMFPRRWLGVRGNNPSFCCHALALEVYLTILLMTLYMYIEPLCSNICGFSSSSGQLPPVSAHVPPQVVRGAGEQSQLLLPHACFRGLFYDPVMTL